jgi:hypothetical protein
MKSWMSLSSDRRSVLRAGLGLAAAAAAGSLAGPLPARAQGFAIRGVSVDVRPLEARGLNGFAEALGAAVHRQFLAQFGDRITGDRRAPLLIVTLTSLSMNASAGSAGGRAGRGGGGGGESDYLQGEVSLGGQSFPLLVQQYSGNGGSWRDPNIDRRRVEALAFAFAQWSRRKIGA